MAKFPRREQRLGVLFKAEGDSAFARDGAEAEFGIDVLDAVDGRHLETALARFRIELERPCADHRVIGHELRRLEIALQIRILHELDVAEVGESLAAYGIVRSVDAQIEIEPGEIVDRVVILAAGQPPHGHMAGVARMQLHEPIEPRANPQSGLRALLVARLRHALGRHVPLLERGSHAFPSLVILRHRCGGRQLFQIHARGGYGAAVTLKAVLFEDRGGIRGRGIRGRRSGAAHPSARQHGGRDAHCCAA